MVQFSQWFLFMKIPIILQARTGSKRFPGKSLKMILGKPLLFYVIQTLQAYMHGEIILAIPDTMDNTPLEDIAKEMRIQCIRGPENNVLKRYVLAAEKNPSTFFFRATADNPLVDYDGFTRLYQYITKHHADYACEKGLPLGAAVEIFTSQALYKSYQLAKTPEDLEHVTVFMKKNPKIFTLSNPPAPESVNFPNLRVTIDYESDFNFIKSFYERYYTGHPFRLSEVIKNLIKLSKWFPPLSVPPG